MTLSISGEPIVDSSSKVVDHVAYWPGSPGASCLEEEGQLKVDLQMRHRGADQERKTCALVNMNKLRCIAICSYTVVVEASHCQRPWRSENFDLSPAATTHGCEGTK